MKHRRFPIALIRAFLTVALAIPAAAQVAAAAPDKPDFQSKTLAVGFAPASPAFRFFSVDALGNGAFGANPDPEGSPPGLVPEARKPGQRDVRL